MKREAGGMLNRAVRAADRALRLVRGIRRFCDDPECLYRLSLGKAAEDTLLPDGTHVRAGETIGILHLWSEHVPAIPASGADLAWACRTLRAARRSLRLLAEHVARDPAWREVRAFAADGLFLQAQGGGRVLEGIGFITVRPPEPLRAGGRLALRGRKLWAWLLRKAFNPRSARGLGPGDLFPRYLWLTRRELLQRYAPRAGAGG
jgi:hypothetical protein